VNSFFIEVQWMYANYAVWCGGSGGPKNNFYLCDATLTWVLIVIVFLCAWVCVCHMLDLYRNGCTDRAVFLHTGFHWLLLHCILGKLGIFKNYGASFGTLSHANSGL